jgi:hypothetical protein
LADTTVDPLSQQVGMGVVAGVLLDHVDEDGAERDTSTLSRRAEINGLADESVAKGDLFAPRTLCPLDDGRVGNGAIEVVVAIQIRRVLAGRLLTKPVSLDIGEMSQETQQREIARRHRAAGHRLVIQAGALHLERQAPI